MNFLESIKTCFKKCFVFNGRASRSEFWYFILFLILAYFIYAISFRFLGDSELYYSLPDTLYYLLEYSITGMYIFICICMIPLISVTVRRIHDVGYSSLILIPFLIVFIISIFFISKIIGFFMSNIIVLCVQIFLLVLLAKKSNDKKYFGDPPNK